MENMPISGIHGIHSSNPDRTDKPDWKRKSEIDKSDLFQKLLDSEMKKLESPDRPKLNDSNTR